MGTDTIKAFSSHGSAVVIGIGGVGSMIALIFGGQVDADVGVPILAGFISGALGFLFGAESAKSAVQSFRQGLDTPTPTPTNGNGEK